MLISNVYHLMIYIFSGITTFLLASEERGFEECLCNIFYIQSVFIILEFNIDVIRLSTLH